MKVAVRVDGAVEDFGRLDGTFHTRDARTHRKHQRVGTGGQSEPPNRAATGPPQQAKTCIGYYITTLTGRAATMMALWEVKKSGRGQVIDLAQYEAVHRRRSGLLTYWKPPAGLPHPPYALQANGAGSSCRCSSNTQRRRPAQAHWRCR